MGLLAYLGIVACSPAALGRVLPENAPDGTRDALAHERHCALLHVHGLVLCNARCAAWHGRHGMLLAHTAFALGGVPKQILQRRRRWISIRTVRHEEGDRV